MKKTIKVTSSQLQKLIQEEAKRQKTILDLQAEREIIINQLNQLNEMYGSMDGDIDEGKFMDLLNKGADYMSGVNNPQKREKYKQKIMQWCAAKSLRCPEGQDLEDAVTAAINNSDVRVTKKGGKWVPVSNVTGDVSNQFNV